LLEAQRSQRIIFVSAAERAAGTKKLCQIFKINVLIFVPKRFRGQCAGSGIGFCLAPSQGINRFQDFETCFYTKKKKFLYSLRHVGARHNFFLKLSLKPAPTMHGSSGR